MKDYTLFTEKEFSRLNKGKERELIAVIIPHWLVEYIKENGIENLRGKLRNN